MDTVHQLVSGASDHTTKHQDAGQVTFEFNFPFKPYDIQVDLMKVAYETFERSRFALLESPTGTGKSLSLISSSLTWLRDHQRKERRTLHEAKDKLSLKIDELKAEEEKTGDWLGVQTKRQAIEAEMDTVNKQLEKLNRFDERNRSRLHARLHGVPLENYTTFSNRIQTSRNLDKSLDESLLNETKETNIIGEVNGASSQNSNLSDQTVHDEDDMDKRLNQQDEDSVRPKIFYASRTHSQLSQFVNEVKRTKFADQNSATESPIKVAALASRANLCVNPEVLKLKDSSAINERCMEMQKETNIEKKCPYAKAKDVSNLKEDILSTVHDIEDLVSRGRAKGACPYYAARMAIPEAELVVLPYNNLLHRETRLASSLDLKDSIVMVDEAHNILETICSIHSAPITGLQLVGCHTILSRYYKKYSSRMNPRNAIIVKLIVQCLTALIRYLKNPLKHIADYECPKAIELDDSETPAKTSSNGGLILNEKGKICKPSPEHVEIMIDTAKFIGASNIERFNVFKITDFLYRSQLARKLLGFFRSDNSLDLSLELYDHAVENVNTLPVNHDDKLVSPKRKKKKRSESSSVKPKLVAQTPSKLPSAHRWQCTSLSFLSNHVNTSIKNSGDRAPAQLSSYPIYTLIEFFRSLTNMNDDGKILTNFYSEDFYKSSLKFLLLNPSSQFKQMTAEARSLVLAGGTMQPFDEFKQLLFGPLGVDESRITLFSCDHVISPQNLFMASLLCGPSNKQLELSYRVRSSLDTIDELGRTIMNISFIVPGGMVCFLPSYDYEQICFNRWTQIGFISKIETRSKSIFREPRQSTQLKPIFDEYAKKIEEGRPNGRGSLLFCVVGGKMSEGINFNDDLGRCVVMVGLPYANVKSGELQEKMRYYDRTCKKENSMSPGQTYYENLCLKGVNQSIGRAIRHRNDYAAVILLDHRYKTRSSIKNGLPRWMMKSYTAFDRFGPFFGQLKAFFGSVHDRFDEV